MTTEKSLQVSVDGSNWFTLPGMSGDWNDEADQIEDTIFGADFSSQQPGLITWTSNGQAFYKGFAGYVAKVKRSGPSTAMTNEATTQVGSSKTYKINTDTKSIWDWSKGLTIRDNGSIVAAANIDSYDHMFGSVTFVAGYSVVGAVTVSGWYFPMTEVARAKSFTLTQTTESIDDTDYPTARANDGYRVFSPGLRTVSLEIGGFFNATDQFWTVLEGRQPIVIEINPDGSDLSRARGIFKLVTRGQSGDVGALEERTLNFGLSVPEQVDVIFSWEHDADTTLSQAIQILINAFINKTEPYVRYMPEGIDAVLFSGAAVLTDISLSSSLDAMNEFQANFQGSGQPTRGALSS